VGAREDGSDTLAPKGWTFAGGTWGRPGAPARVPRLVAGNVLPLRAHHGLAARLERLQKHRDGVCGSTGAMLQTLSVPLSLRKGLHGRRLHGENGRRTVARLQGPAHVLEYTTVAYRLPAEYL